MPISPVKSPVVLSTQGAKAADYSKVSISQVSIYRDGGSVDIKGKLPDGTAASVYRMGKPGDPNRGRFLVKEGAGKERPMTGAELKGLEKSFLTKLAEEKAKPSNEASVQTHESVAKMFAKGLELADTPMQPKKKSVDGFE
jgi:hypothetical protein